MTRQDDDYSGDLAHWLEDSGRRRVVRLEESPENLLAYLEELSGKKLRSREDLVVFFDELKVRDAATEERVDKRIAIREAVLFVLLALAIGQYYFWDVSLQISNVGKIYYFVTQGSVKSG